MECINMSYKGFNFTANPKTLSANFSKKTAKAHIPFKLSRTFEICEEPAVISGSGSFSGKDAAVFANRLAVTFKSKNSAYLFSPLFSPLKVFFTSLELSANAERDCIDYSFTFTEDCGGKKRRYPFAYTRALEGENLYDVANRTGVAVERLFEFNDYKDLFSVKEGDKIWLM